MELDESMILITSTGPAAEYACNILIFYLYSTDFKSLGHWDIGTFGPSVPGTVGPWDFQLRKRLYIHKCPFVC